MKELKPCLFCGGKAYRYSGDMMGDTTILSGIKCSNCGASIWDFISPYQPDAKEREDALDAAWNNREACRPIILAANEEE